MIDEMIRETEKELKALKKYPDAKLIEIIKEVGFECDLCGMCCTRQFNDHVFLLEKDVEAMKQIDESLITPAPYYEFCDQKGNFYVSGYSLRTKEDGSCVLLENNRCTIYDKRPTICSLYPYMLHRETDEEGNLDWRQISGLDQHGCYHSEITDEDVKKIASDIKEYEEAYLEQQIAFFKKVKGHFKENGSKHVKSVYDRQMRSFEKGKEIPVYVFHNNELELCRISKEE
ncbi:YkgJ family cysteine cluster protein [Methanococcoides sp. SA1]|nr:YkgJ family cysteine cluster protein [Methanococcoides sp. SA1]